MAFLQSPALSSASKLRVAFLGPLGSFSHEAAVASFGSEALLLPQSSFHDAFAAIQSNSADYAAIPLENSSNGAVVQTYDLLADREKLYGDITICGEYYLAVHHCLLVKQSGNKSSLGVPKDITTDARYKSITKLYTHPQAWGQCEKFLSKHFKGVERQDVSSTSKAAEIVSQETDGHGAAIANKFAAEYHKLDILAQNIEDNPENTTRFLLLRNKKAQNTAQCNREPRQSLGKPKHKTLMSFIVDHNSPGSLADALVIFKQHGMNLTTINSRPSGIHPWQYVFFVECQPTSETWSDDLMDNVIEDLKAVTKSSRHLGSWSDALGSK
ncbi:predicted protein [Uncinocarpus reesii 1704]|uniref:prephenate dehydratase n=1 Tax=Uncinocarpus reesii (strain UAMH 1704) TaxID=336963 RepID=C4JMH0_UNCRE|nr:uncharacterized protein UREG_04028 [Uncinocarpus reesii 1704]EEP79182.1 predicted protein [Uncinocarpus reesii 1704]